MAFCEINVPFRFFESVKIAKRALFPEFFVLFYLFLLLQRTKDQKRCLISNELMNFEDFAKLLKTCS